MEVTLFDRFEIKEAGSKGRRLKIQGSWTDGERKKRHDLAIAAQASLIMSLTPIKTHRLLARRALQVV